MAVQQHPSFFCKSLYAPTKLASFFSASANPVLSYSAKIKNRSGKEEPCAIVRLTCSSSSRRRSSRRFVVLSSDSAGSESLGGKWQDWWKPPQKGLVAPGVSLSDVLWPSAGAFAAMAILGRLDQMIASRGLSFTIAPLGAVSAVLFATPNSPSAQKYNMFVAQVGCAAFGVLALSMFGPGWFARATAVAASLAFMVLTGATHPPAASLPILFIDSAKFHQLNYWYALFPGAFGCVLLCLIQEVVNYLKKNWKF